MKSYFYGFMVFLFVMGTLLPAQSQIDESKLTWKPDRGVSLNGSTDYYQVEAAPEFDVFEITVEGWVRFRDIEGQQQVIGRGGAANYFTHYANNGNYRFLVENFEEGYDFGETPMPPADTWVHITGTYDESVIRLYYNGILVDETEYPGVMRGGGDPVMIGALAPGQRHLNGLFENLRIWDRSLSQEEIDDLLATSPEEENISQMVDNGLIAYWSSSALSDGVIEDLAGNNNAVYQEFTLDETLLTFKPEGGISFDGQGTYTVIEDITDFNVPAFSTEVWVYLDATHPNQVFMNRGGAPQDFTFYLYEDGVRFLTQNETSYNQATGVIPPANTWVHIVGTLSAEGVKRIYYNGILQNENMGPPNPITSDNPLYIGALEPGSRHLDGQMENLRFWNKALTEAEIQALLQTSPEEEDIEAMVNNGLVAYWAQRSVDGNTLVDLTGNGHDGQMSAFEIDETYVTFKPDQGIHFDGENTYGMIEDITPFDLDHITVEAWVNVTPLFHQIELGTRGIFSRGNSNTSFTMYGSNNFGNRLHFEISDFGDSAAPMTPAGEWVHVTGTYNENTLSLYYNGIMVDSVSAPGIIDWSETPVYIGALGQGSGLFEGQLDYIRVWNRALSAEEIQALLATAPSDEDISEMTANGLLVYYTSDNVTTDQLTDISGNENHAAFFGLVSVNQWSLY